MKTLRKHTAILLIAFLGLFYALPYSLLHNCDSLNHHHTETCIESDHISCNLCDLQLLPFTSETCTFQFRLNAVETAHRGASLFSIPDVITGHTCNRGPPVCF